MKLNQIIKKKKLKPKLFFAVVLSVSFIFSLFFFSLHKVEALTSFGVPLIASTDEPSVLSDDVKGGFHQVVDETALLAISCQRRQEGMLVWVKDATPFGPGTGGAGSQVFQLMDPDLGCTGNSLNTPTSEGGTYTGITNINTISTTANDEKVWHEAALGGAGGAGGDGLWKQVSAGSNSYIYNKDNQRVGIRVGSVETGSTEPLNAPTQDLTIGEDRGDTNRGNFAVQMRTPIIPLASTTVLPLSGGSMPIGVYAFRIAALDIATIPIGETKASVPVSCTTVVGSQTCPLQWVPSKGASSYKIYVQFGGSGPWSYFITPGTVVGLFVTYDWTSSLSGLPSVVDPIEASTAFINKISASSTSWINGGNVGIGTSNPGVKFDVMGITRSGDFSVAPANAGLGTFVFSGDSVTPLPPLTGGHNASLYLLDDGFNTATSVKVKISEDSNPYCNLVPIGTTGALMYFNETGAPYSGIGCWESLPHNIRDLPGIASSTPGVLSKWDYVMGNGLAPNDVFNRLDGRVGVSVGDATETDSTDPAYLNPPTQDLTIGEDQGDPTPTLEHGAFATQMRTPRNLLMQTGLTPNDVTSGSAGDLYFAVSALDIIGGETLISIPTTNYCTMFIGSGNQRCKLTWDSVPGAAKYKLYIDQNSDADNNFYTGLKSTYVIPNAEISFEYLPSTFTTLPNQSLPIKTTAYVNKLAAKGDSWIGGGKVGINMANSEIPSTPIKAPLTVHGPYTLDYLVGIAKDTVGSLVAKAAPPGGGGSDSSRLSGSSCTVTQSLLCNEGESCTVMSDGFVACCPAGSTTCYTPIGASGGGSGSTDSGAGTPMPAGGSGSSL